LPFTDGLVGADLRRTTDLPVTVLSGRLPQAGSLTEVAVTDGYIRALGLRDTQAKLVVGTELEYGSPRVYGSLGTTAARGRWVRAAIVGVVAQDVDSHQSVLAPIEAVQAARTWTTSGDNPAAFNTPQSPYAALFVVADSLAAVPRVRQRITKLGFANSAPETVIANVQRYVHVVEIVLGGIGLIGLIIAALGISNAMLAAVRERRREIGVMKAIGARDRDVRRVFLLEAAFLGALGGAAGTLFGWAIARTLAAVVNGFLHSQNLAGVGVSLPLSVVLVGVFGAALLALVAGTLPALRAARLPARQAMGDR
jgi:ABC-type antimicrobial peptide transport system permease subunit